MAEAHPDVARRFAFFFPAEAGHVNPSLGIIRTLVSSGHEVHFVSFESVRKAVEGAGAVFHAVIDVEPEYYAGRNTSDCLATLQEIAGEIGLQDEHPFLAREKAWSVGMEMQLPGALRFLRRLAPHAVVYDPLLWGACGREAHYAAQVLGIPAVALLTVAGPGAWEAIWLGMLKSLGLACDDLERMIREFIPNVAAVSRLNAAHGLQLSPDGCMPRGRLPLGSDLTLVTTSADLQDPLSPELARCYEDGGATFRSVGTLLDVAGAQRATGNISKDAPEDTSNLAPDVVTLARKARASGRPVVLASMGTVITGNHPEFGWEGHVRGPDGHRRGLTGRDLCRAAWAGAFDACGAGSADEGALLLVSLGPKADPLGEVSVPPNAVCAPFLPQVDILREGVSAFITHGGQNSFTESLGHSTPVVVCPGFGDQVVNGRKAVELGVGLVVGRPDPDPGCEAAAIAGYRADVCQALRRVLSCGDFAAAAAGCAERLQAMGGVRQATKLVLAAAAPLAPTLPGAKGAAAGA